MSELFLIEDIYLTIFSFLPSIKNIIHLSLLSSSHLKSVRKYSWKNTISLLNNNMMQIIIDNYNFKVLKLSPSITFNKVVLEYLKHCHTLDLTWCYNITDESVKELKNCHTLYLTRTK